MRLVLTVLTATSAASLPTKPAKPATARRVKAITAARRTAVPPSARLPSDVPALPAAETEVAKSNAPVDPISFGLKWNGSNDSAGQTRIETSTATPPGPAPKSA